MLLAKQRQDLIDNDLEIPVFEGDDQVVEYMKLTNWVQVLAESDTGIVTTELGKFDSIDLEFKEEDIHKEFNKGIKLSDIKL